jgi:hypothetical protein
MTDLTAEWCRESADDSDALAHMLETELAGAEGVNPEAAHDERKCAKAFRIAARVLDEKTVEEVAQRLARYECGTWAGLNDVEKDFHRGQARAVLAYLKGGE